MVLAVKKVFTTIFLNLCNFEKERGTSEKQEITSLDLQEIDQCVPYLVSFQSYRDGAVFLIL